MGQPLPVRADQPRDVLALSLDADFCEDLQPGLDPRLDRVDERAIEIEDQSARILELVESAQRLPRRTTKATTPTMSTAASPTAISTSFEDSAASTGAGAGVGGGMMLTRTPKV